VSSYHEPLIEGATKKLAEFSAAVKYSDVPEDDMDYLKLLVLDGLGACLFGTTLPWVQKVVDMVEEQGGVPQATIYGTSIKTSVSLAALVNSTAGHSYELDDNHRGAIFHPGSMAPPVALAMSEYKGGVSGKDYLAAVAAGYEVGSRIGVAGTQMLLLNGFQAQGTTGTFTASAAAARILELSPEETQNALGIGGSQASGLLAAQEGAEMKRLNSGRAAQSGVYGALLAKRGFTGVPDIVEAGYGGFLSSIAREVDTSKLLVDLGKSWEIKNVGIRFHASVASIHSALDILSDLIKEEGLTADDIEKIEVGVSPLTVVHCAWPYTAQGVTGAQMNLFYSLAMMIVDGEVFIDQFREERLRDPRVLALIERIESYEDEEIAKGGPATRHGSRMLVKTLDGREFSRFKENRHGAAEFPATPDEIKNKFRALATRALPEDAVEEIITLIDKLEECDDVTHLSELMTASNTG